MNYQPDTFIEKADEVAQARSEFAGYLSNMAQTLASAELEGESTSGKLGLESSIEDLKLNSKKLEEGVFRLLVLGDMKRGKSTFLNALLGEKILPADVNPCTAVLTVLRYGKEKTVTVYFNDGKNPEKLDFDNFKQRYTIPADEAKKLEEERKQAFPDVDYAVVEYPLPLLEKGVEIIDSPGLNDTETRDKLTLSYIHNCQAILFVLSAIDGFTSRERSYLDNHIKSRGLTTFFLINRWDLISILVRDEDEEDNLQQVKEAEERQRQVFRTNLWDYCQVEGKDLYDERVFELSAKSALRQRIKGESLEGTGLPQFLKALSEFLAKDRAASELRQADAIALVTRNQVHEAVELRKPLLDQPLEELKEKIKSVRPEFDELLEIRDGFSNQIRITRDYQADKISDNFRGYIIALGDTFEKDFKHYQPELNFLELLWKPRREQFEAKIKEGFEEYIRGKISEWNRRTEKEMYKALEELAKSASNYGKSFGLIADTINQKLTGKEIAPPIDGASEDKSPRWAKAVVGIGGLVFLNVGNAILAGSGVVSLQKNLNQLIGVILVIAAIPTIGPIAAALVSLGLSGVTAEITRREVIKAITAKLNEYLPQLAQEQSIVVNKAIRDYFEAYGTDVVKEIEKDIYSMKVAIEDLLKQKESQDINREAEIKRLNQLKDDIILQYDIVSQAYKSFRDKQ